jgi:O-antigen ligase
VPRYLATKNPDVVSGTFGENAYQLVFFLLVMIGLLGSIYTFEKQRLIARFIPLVVVAMIVIIFLAQFRALLFTMGLAIGLVGMLLSTRSPRGAVAAALTIAALVITLGFVAQNVPALKFGAALDDVRAEPTRYFDTRLRVAEGIEDLYNDNTRFMLTGTGPGTYSSRAWRTFAVDANSSESAASGPLRLLTGGQGYSTDVSDKYVRPQLENIEVVSGSRAVSSPYSSYLSLLAEVGVLGFGAILATYIAAFFAALRMTRNAMRTAMPGDPLPGLLCASTVAFFVLPQMALLENWLEVTRVTFLSWILLAVATKEFDARRAGGPTSGGGS